ncbi:type I-E CRISPR-associated protein Cas7/Cse4/CasC [bacterium]|nr:type I-E CRISPR-associated protein Cas7/Cse4/CasC [bacterium]
MNLELHILQNFAPANLNRDDTGSPKTCDFGGVRRGRISSQAIKRAIRYQFREHQFPLVASGERSKRLRNEVAKALAGRRDQSDAKNAFDAAMAILGILSEERGDAEESDIRTEVLVFASPTQIAAISDVCDGQWDELQAIHQKLWPSGKTKKPSKDGAKKMGSADLKGALWDAIDSARSADLALFGRMLADLPKGNIDAASQVAHAISTHAISAEFDYYTAVDDLKPEDTAGADMIGTVEFNSACYYRYANIDLGQLRKNLDGDAELAAATVDAFLAASRDAIPTGKQNSFAAQNPPSLLFAVLRDRGAWSLANAFLKPVRQDRDTDLAQASAKALDGYWGELTGTYGEPAGAQLSVVALDGIKLGSLERDRASNFREFADTISQGVAAGMGQ